MDEGVPGGPITDTRDGPTRPFPCVRDISTRPVPGSFAGENRPTGTTGPETPSKPSSLSSFPTPFPPLSGHRSSVYSSTPGLRFGKETRPSSRGGLTHGHRRRNLFEPVQVDPGPSLWLTRDPSVTVVGRSYCWFPGVATFTRLTGVDSGPESVGGIHGTRREGRGTGWRYRADVGAP